MTLIQTSILVILFSVSFAFRADYKPPPGQLNRRFFWSSDAPLTRAINDLAREAIPHINFTTRHFARMEAAVLKSLNRTRVLPDDPIVPCDPSVHKQYRESYLRAFGIRGFPEPAWDCSTDIYGVDVDDEPPGYTLDDIYNSIFQQKAELQKREKELSARVIKNFTGPAIPFNFSYNTRSARCTLTQACMTRIGENWHQLFQITSNGIDEHLKDESRQAVGEYVRVISGPDGDQLGDNLLLRLPVFDNGSIERVYREDATTMIERWARTPSSSCFRPISTEENPAMVDALSLVDHSSQQAEDALTTSNLSILLLPLGLNLIPIAFFATVSTRVMLMYTLLSDVLTVIPLAIKGVELIIIGSVRHRSVVTRVLSPIMGNSTYPEAAGGEVWAAECRVREEAGQIGVILLVTAAVFLVIGIVGEILARKFIIRKTRRKAALLKAEDSEDESWTELICTADIGDNGSDDSRYSSDGKNV